MTYLWKDLFWIFYIYSLIGWCAGVAADALKRKKFINTGFLNLPLCPIYGSVALAFCIFLPELKNHWFFLALGGSVLAFVVIVITGKILEHVFGRKWWDCSKTRFQFQGYLNYKHLLGFAAAAVVSIKVLNPLLVQLISMIPGNIERILRLILSLLFLADILCCVVTVLRLHRAVKIVRFMGCIQDITEYFGNAITRRIQRRMEKAYPNLEVQKLLDTPQKEKQKEVFAEGCSFYKLACLFFIGAFLGDVTETIFCYVTSGELMSRSSVVYGPFSIVWGLGCGFLTAFLYAYRDRSDRYIFVCGTILGGAYEYICSVFTELVFGTVFWDYSKIPFNLGGRINLLYCFFWGIAAVVWLKILYPPLSSRIERIPKRLGTALTWAMVVFMTVNILISGLALYRYDTRREQPQPKNDLEAFLDRHFYDDRMERIYPNAKEVEEKNGDA